MQKIFDKFGLTKEKVVQLDRSRRSLLLLIGLALIILFASFVSIVPEISNRFGELAKKKESQLSRAANNPPPCDKKGDWNNDGEITKEDEIQILRYIAGLSTTPLLNKTDAIDRADVDGNLLVNGNDSVWVLHFLNESVFTFPMCYDHDDDGYSDGIEESYLGTDPLASCSRNSSHDAWPPDFDNNQVINTTDVFSVLPPTFGKNENSLNWETLYKRSDLDPNGVINVTDIFKVLPPTMGSSCSEADLPDNPRIDLSVSQNPVIVGIPVAITWTAADAIDPCKASSVPALLQWSGQERSAGSKFVAFPTVGIYTLRLICWGAGGDDINEVTVQVIDQPPTPTDPPPEQEILLEPRDWPIRGRGTIGGLDIHFTTTLEYRDAAAVDILAPGGTPIYSTMNGTVDVLPWDDNCGYGLDITSSSGFLIHFCHLHNNINGDFIVVRDGDTVTKRDHIGYIGYPGEWGNATATHAHYAIRDPINNGGVKPGEMVPDFVPFEPHTGHVINCEDDTNPNNNEC